jgi:hypothetical protein
MTIRPQPLPPSDNLRLDSRKIIETVEILRERIHARFPGSGLSRLADDLVHVARAAVDRVVSVTRPHIPLRIGAALVILLMIGGIIAVFTSADVPTRFGDIGEFVQTIEAALNEMVLIGASIFFLVTYEGRIKRNRALHFLRELRALAHIVDMHQLTKDPERFSRETDSTAAAVAQPLAAPELARYLDYCSEMLSLISKIAALYIQNFNDPVVLAAVDEVEDLTTSLARKIWQKIMILDRTL